MNFLITTLTFGISVFLMVAISQLIMNVVSLHSERQPLRVRIHKTRL